MALEPIKVIGDIQNKKLIPLYTTNVGPGIPLEIGAYKSLRIEVWGTGTYSLQIQAFGDSGTARTLPVWDIANKGFVDGNVINAAGFYDVDVQGFSRVQANVSAISGGDVNASGGLMT